MNMKILGFILIFASLLNSERGFAANRPQNINELFERVESMSPDIQKARNNLDVVKQRLTLAGQIPNPELSIGSWNGRAGSKKWKQNDITITQPLELGGKRGSRIDVVEAEIKQSNVELMALVAQVRLKVLFTLFRLRQLKEELDLLIEAKKTFAHLVNNYKNRPQLSPEQSTSMFIFELAGNDYELKVEESYAELNALESEARILTGYSYDELAPILPKRIVRWPTFQGLKELNSPTLKSITAQTQLSESELELAKSDAWPTISIGPSYTAQNQFGEKANIMGVVVSFPIPILNQNNGAKAIALKSIVANRKLFEIEKSVLETRRVNLAKTYLSSSKVLESQANSKDLHDKHVKVENNFLRGLISSPLVIESHRQIYENQKLYHLRELQTLDVYYQLILLAGEKVEGF